MKMKKIITILFLLIGIGLAAVRETNSGFYSNIQIIENTFETGITLDFYTRSDSNAVGFNISGIQNYDNLTYEVKYRHDSLEELVTGSFILTGEYSKVEEWILLGTCSDLGTVCTYDDIVGDVTLTVNLFRQSSLDKTLQKVLTP